MVYALLKVTEGDKLIAVGLRIGIKIVVWVCRIGGFMDRFLGGFDDYLHALVAFVMIDYITGFMAAFFTKKLSSETGFKGICKKVVIFYLVGIGHIIDAQVIGNGSVLRTVVILFYLSNEGISIIENVTIIGLPVPKKLIKVLEQLHDDAEETDE
ncbi:MAG: phage holin family protein [Lachnospiraceae bacterium]|nr:phage holin family protein [Lachnospiraceae bacterium]